MVVVMSSGPTDGDFVPTLGESVRRPGDMRHAVVQTEQAIARTATEGLDDWTREVSSALKQMREAIDEHIRLTEGPEGLHDEIRLKAPRLSAQIKRLQRDHPILHARVRELIALLDRPGIGDHWSLDEARSDIRRLLRMAERHSQSTADVVWEAYHLDIGGVE
jgi:hypothetical protein